MRVLRHDAGGGWKATSSFGVVLPLTGFAHMGVYGTLSALTSQHKNSSDRVKTLLYRVVLGDMTFYYDDVNIQQQGEAYILTYKTKAHNFVSVSKLRSGFT